MSLYEVRMPQIILGNIACGKPISYMIHFVAVVDRLMASPSDAAIANNDLYKAKSLQAPAKAVVTRWRRLQRLGILAFGDPCTLTEVQQEVTFSCLIDRSW